jgi:hypothetical protein
MARSAHPIVLKRGDSPERTMQIALIPKLGRDVGAIRLDMLMSGTVGDTNQCNLSVPNFNEEDVISAA